MAHFAEIDENNLVIRVLRIADEQEERGQEHLAEDLKQGGTWLQTSYNTRGGVHINGGTPFRKNMAGIGWIWDESRDAFYEPSPYPSWILDEESCYWQAPKPEPSEGWWTWDEEQQEWVER